MSYAGNTSDIEQEKSEFLHSQSTTNISGKNLLNHKIKGGMWYEKRDEDSASETSDSDHFLAKGAFLLTPSHDLSMERAATICEKMSFKGCYSLTKTATGILFKFSNPEDYQAVYKKGFYKVTGARFYKKIAIPCRPQKTFTLFVSDIPEEVPVEDIRHSLYRFDSVVEVVRLLIPNSPAPEKNIDGTIISKQQQVKEENIPKNKDNQPSPIRITLASLDEYNILLQCGLDFYGATFFPTEANINFSSARIAYKKNRMIDGTIPGRVRELLPVFDAAGFCRIPPPASKIIKPRS